MPGEVISRLGRLVPEVCVAERSVSVADLIKLAPLTLLVAPIDHTSNGRVLRSTRDAASTAGFTDGWVSPPRGQSETTHSAGV